MMNILRLIDNLNLLTQRKKTDVYVYRRQFYMKVKLATVVEGDLKAPFSIAAILRRRGGRYFFPWIAPLFR